MFELSGAQLGQWQMDGYLIVRGLFAKDDVQQVRDRFDRLGDNGEPVQGHWTPDRSSTDPLKRYPRVMHPHRFCPLSKRMMLKPEVADVLRQLYGEEAVACQSMFYFKPPGSAGQALHQDNFYLAIQPGTCIAAWTAIDPATPDNGGLYVVPGSHKIDVMCPDPERFRDGQQTNIVDPPPGMKAVPAVLDSGDTLFFNGSVVHGSGRNRSESKWRRSFIGHYMPARSTHVSASYFPITSFDGREVTYEAAQVGGPCGEAITNALGRYAASYGVDALIH